MPTVGPFEPSLTGLFEATWRPKKAVSILWRRVETINPDAYEAVVAWAQQHHVIDAAIPWLEAMATNEVAIDPLGALAELDRLLQHRPPELIAEATQLLRDLIWEASDASNDWLAWRPCRICGRRWATTPLEGFTLCPPHRTPMALIVHLHSEMVSLTGLVDHAPLIARLEQLAPAPPLPAPPAPMARVSLNGVGGLAEVSIIEAWPASVEEPAPAVAAGGEPED